MPRRNSLRRFGIPHITAYWVILQVVCMLLTWMEPRAAERLVFDPALVMQGQWWRILTFLVMPQSTSPIFAVFVYYFFWLMGTALENQWGVGRYNLFLLLGAVLNIAAGFIPYFITGTGGVSTNTYLLESVFLAFAVFYPDFIITLFFVLPVKIKWLAALTSLLYCLQFFLADWVGRAMIVASLGNFLLFFSKDLLLHFRQGGRLIKSQLRVVPAPAATTLHRCSVCGITEKSAPDAEFRYCSNCGGKCFCLVHLKDHVCTLPTTL